MVNVNAIKDSTRFEFIKSMLGNPHTTVFKDDKVIALWYIEEDDKKALEEMAVEKKTMLDE